MALVGKNKIKLAVCVVVIINTAPVICSLYTHLDKCQSMFVLQACVKL